MAFCPDFAESIVGSGDGITLAISFGEWIAEPVIGAGFQLYALVLGIFMEFNPDYKTGIVVLVGSDNTFSVCFADFPA